MCSTNITVTSCCHWCWCCDTSCFKLIFESPSHWRRNESHWQSFSPTNEKRTSCSQSAPACRWMRKKQTDNPCCHYSYAWQHELREFLPSQQSILFCKRVKQYLIAISMFTWRCISCLAWIPSSTTLLSLIQKSMQTMTSLLTCVPGIYPTVMDKCLISTSMQHSDQL